MLGASQVVAEAAVQNPEFPSLLFEPATRKLKFTVEQISQEGRQLLASSSSYSHSLDRIRFLRQKWTFLITLHDLLGWTEPPSIWKAISALADVIMTLTYEEAWEYHARMRKLEGTCPVLVVAFGKQGGSELNYSSDIDLAFVNKNGLTEKEEAEARRFCEAYVNALSQKMGRGALYRVDLRLRPYGSAGEITRSMRGYEAYYELYAEPWETQALIRARPVVGPVDLAENWESLRVNRCFRPNISEFTIQEVLAMRQKIDAFAKSEDFKRGPGGIRDIEFIVQALQLIHGFEFPVLRSQPTLETLEAAINNDLIPELLGRALEKDYTYLRQLEHRCQLGADQQTHTLPTDPSELKSVALLMGHPKSTELQESLANLRSELRDAYSNWFSTEPGTERRLDFTIQELGLASAWLEPLIGIEGTGQVMFENRDTASRLLGIIRQAPALLSTFRSSASLTEALISGEIFEIEVGASRVTQAWRSTDDLIGAKRMASLHATIWTRWVLGSDTIDPWDLSSRLLDRLIIDVTQDSPVPLSVIALGSYANRESGPKSDADLMVLVENGSDQSLAEGYIGSVLSRFKKWHGFGAPTEVDLRLRPDGKKGLLVTTLEGFAHYEQSDMELWERFALGHCRLISGEERCYEAVKSAASKVLDVEGARELIAIKARIENERVSAENQYRDVKLGSGGLNDIEWLMRLSEMKLGIAGAGRTRDRLASLPDSDVTVGIAAHKSLLALRAHLSLMEYKDDLVPTDEDQLSRLANSMGFSNRKDFLLWHLEMREMVRTSYHQHLERLFGSDFR